MAEQVRCDDAILLGQQRYTPLHRTGTAASAVHQDLAGALIAIATRSPCNVTVLRFAVASLLAESGFASRPGSRTTPGAAATAAQALPTKQTLQDFHGVCSGLYWLTITTITLWLVSPALLACAHYSLQATISAFCASAGKNQDTTTASCAAEERFRDLRAFAGPQSAAHPHRPTDRIADQPAFSEATCGAKVVPMPPHPGWLREVGASEMPESGCRPCSNEHFGGDRLKRLIHVVALQTQAGSRPPLSTTLCGSRSPRPPRLQCHRWRICSTLPPSGRMSAWNGLIRRWLAYAERVQQRSRRGRRQQSTPMPRAARPPAGSANQDEAQRFHRTLRRRAAY